MRSLPGGKQLRNHTVVTLAWAPLDIWLFVLSSVPALKTSHLSLSLCVWERERLWIQCHTNIVELSDLTLSVLTVNIGSILERTRRFSHLEIRQQSPTPSLLYVPNTKLTLETKCGRRESLVAGTEDKNTWSVLQIQRTFSGWIWFLNKQSSLQVGTRDLTTGTSARALYTQKYFSTCRL